MRVWTTVIGQRLDGAENTRSMLLSAELLRRGHEVTMWTSAYDHIRKEWRREWRASGGAPVRRDDGLEIRFLEGCGYAQNVSVRRFVDHWLAARHFERAARSLPRPDVIVSSLPDHLTAAATVSFGRRAGVPTIVDVRDKWPDVFVDRAGHGARRALANAVLFTEHRRSARTLRGASAIVGSMQSMLDWALEKAGRVASERERVFYLTTFPRNFDVAPVHLSPTSTVARALARAAGRVTFAFVGTFNRTQHPLLILDALDRLQQEGRLDASRTAFLIAGDGLDADAVRVRAARHRNVEVVGWVDTDEMRALLAASHVGLLPMNFPSPAFNNKAFAYLASGLPVISGAEGDLAVILEEERAGINVRGGDPEALAAAIHALASDHERRAGLARGARRLFLDRFDRDANYRAYADHIERVTAAAAAP